MGQWLRGHLDAAKAIGKPLLFEEFGKKLDDASDDAIGRLRDPVYREAYKVRGVVGMGMWFTTCQCAAPAATSQAPVQMHCGCSHFALTALLLPPHPALTPQAIEEAVQTADQPLLGSLYWKWAFPKFGVGPYGVEPNDSTMDIIETHAKRMRSLSNQTPPRPGCVMPIPSKPEGRPLGAWFASPSECGTCLAPAAVPVVEPAAAHTTAAHTTAAHTSAACRLCHASSRRQLVLPSASLLTPPLHPRFLSCPQASACA